jgi:hypothetical protein
MSEEELRACPICGESHIVASGCPISDLQTRVAQLEHEHPISELQTRVAQLEHEQNEHKNRGEEASSQQQP